MDKNKLEYLKEKRILLKKEIRLKELRDKISSELNYLKEQNFTFNIFYNFEYVNWINNNINVRNKDGYRGSHGDFQINVNDREVISTPIETHNDLLTIKSVTAFFKDISNNTTFIVCSLSGNPELEISKEAFLSNPSLFFSSPETWILSADKKYIIENIWSQNAIRFINITQPDPILKIKLLVNA